MTLVAATLLTAAGLVPPVDLRASVSPPEVTVGERASVFLRLPLPEGGATPRLERPPRRWGGAEVLEVDGPERVRETDGGEHVRWRLGVAAFRPGRVELPALELDLRTADGRLEATAPPVSFTVRSVLTDDPRPALRPPSPPRQLPVGMPFWATSGLLAALSLAAGVVLFLRADRTAPGKTRRDELEPFDLGTALARIEEGLERHHDPEEAHRALSMAIRRHLEGRLALPAPRRATPEIAALLGTAPCREEVVDFLETCDRVTYGDTGATPRDTRRRLDEARRLGESIESIDRSTDRPGGGR